MASHLLFKSATGEIVKVKLGFSWQAFFIGSFKAVVMRTWLVVAIAIAGYVFYDSMERSGVLSSRNIALLLALLVFYFGYMVFCGIYGNRWLVASLIRQGYRQVGEERR